MSMEVHNPFLLQKGGQAAELAARYMEEGASASDAAKRAAAETGVKKGEIYRLIAR